MITAWRLVKKSRAADAFTGEGARRYGGRWNRAGTPAVYCSESLSLAALETFVHLVPANRGLLFSAFRVEIPDRVSVETLDRSTLPADWRSEPPPPGCQSLGDAWLRSSSAAVWLVPSVIVPAENNLVLNIDHPDFGDLSIDRREDFSFDPRMWKV